MKQLQHCSIYLFIFVCFQKVLNSDGTYFYRDIEFGQAGESSTVVSKITEKTKNLRELKKVCLNILQYNFLFTC